MTDQPSVSPQDSQYQLALSIARAVQMGLPAPDSAEAIRNSVEDALQAEAMRNERSLAQLRVAAVALFALLALLAHLFPWLVGLREYPAWPAAAALLWLAAAAAFLFALARGRYHPSLRRLTPAVDALSIAVATWLFLLSLGPERPALAGFLGVVAAACAFVAFSGALRLSRSAARLSSGLAALAWLVVAWLAQPSFLAVALIAATVIVTGLLGTRVTRIIRRVVTDEVTRVRLSRLYDDARAAVEAREEVLKIVAHDLRNPLNTIGMAADFLLEFPASEEQRRRQLAIVKRSSERMNRLIHDLLDVARMEAGKLTVEPRPVPIAELFGSVGEMMRPLAADKELELHLLPPDGLPPIRVDPDRILQVFSNLIGNAIKFTPEGGRITVRAERLAEKVRLSVTDTGPGIPQEQLPRIFARMWQAERSDTRGIGLGLTIAQGIIEAHGERIGVESRLGEGTQFWFTAPVAEDRRR